jgi:hypothetical protein
MATRLCSLVGPTVSVEFNLRANIAYDGLRQDRWSLGNQPMAAKRRRKQSCEGGNNLVREGSSVERQAATMLEGRKESIEGENELLKAKICPKSINCNTSI